MGEFQHIPVLLEECMEGLALRPNGIYVDGTVGGAGHSLKIAESLGPQGRLIALDKDPDAVAVASERLAQYPCAQVVQTDFSRMCETLDRLGIDSVDGILLDLGVSSFQLDTPERGFSYMHDAPLDMRMSRTGLSAYDVVNTYDFQALCRVMREYGEERYTPAVAKGILRRREQHPIETTGELVEVIRSSLPAKARREGGGHPAKRVFQAIRIEVNGELDSLSQFFVRSVRTPQTGRTDGDYYISLAGRPDGQAAVCGALQGLHLPAGFSGLCLWETTAWSAGQPQTDRSGAGGTAGELPE